MIEIYRAGSQLIKVRMMMIVAALAAAASLYWGWEMFNTYGLRPADGGMLAPVGVRLAWGLSIALLGCAFLAGMWVYGRLYVTRIGYDQARDLLHVSTLEGLVSRTRTWRPSDLMGAGFHHGRMDTPRGQSVRAPWYTLRLKGRRWPLIVDAQGSFAEPELAARLLGIAGTAAR